MYAEPDVIKDDQNAPEALRRDAELWRALVNKSGRLRFMGSAGFDQLGHPRPGKPLHFCMEFWDIFPPHPDLGSENELSREILTSFARALVERAALTPKE